MSEHEINEFKGANIRFLIDDSGNHWIYKSETEATAKLADETCTRADEWVYDRNFGG